MESNDKLKETDIKKWTCYYLGGIININDLALDNISIEKKNTKYFNLWYRTQKTPYGGKPSHIDLNKVDEYIRKCDKSRYFTLFHSDEKYRKHLIELDFLFGLKSNHSDIYFHK